MNAVQHLPLLEQQRAKPQTIRIAVWTLEQRKRTQEDECSGNAPSTLGILLVLFCGLLLPEVFSCHSSCRAYLQADNPERVQWRLQLLAPHLDVVKR
eukprot:2499321-Amphidinium_carterae.1